MFGDISYLRYYYHDSLFWNIKDKFITHWSMCNSRSDDFNAIDIDIVDL